jgi:hypothetical protein
MTTPEHRMADALRVVALRLEHAMDSGHHSSRIDAHDLLETLLEIAEELDPATPLDNTPTA